MLPASVEVAALRFLLYLIAHTLSDEIPAPEARPAPRHRRRAQATALMPRLAVAC